MADISDHLEAAGDQWRSYDEFAAGIDTYRLPSADLTGRWVELDLGGDRLRLEFPDAGLARWSSPAFGTGRASDGPASVDPYDAVQVRPGVVFVNLELRSREREAITVIWSTRTGRALVTHSRIRSSEEAAADGEPQVTQTFHPGVLTATEAGPAAAPSGPAPAPSRDLIGKRNVYRYSPEHLYEHTYMSSERYMWQCLQGVQRGHGDVDRSTVWKFDDGLYLFCFREFKIAVASVWLHDLGYDLRTTGVFLGLTASDAAAHSRAGGHIYPLGAVTYPDVQPV
ncbi:MoaF C-terminal domain-containing protein [Herbiconiux sp.]|uniref:MoaF C-terminal domain-containing protein n=1 Tax=Herbiconiux sp. TaxID=1871186 RepID=UPI0025C1EC3E|nr:MoaF C-terminal domain-containing protein [Herbiconiux sp.]